MSNKLSDWSSWADELKNSSPLIDESELSEAGDCLEEAISFAASVEYWTRPGKAVSPQELRENVRAALGIEDFA